MLRQEHQVLSQSPEELLVDRSPNQPARGSGQDTPRSDEPLLTVRGKSSQCKYCTRYAYGDAEPASGRRPRNPVWSIIPIKCSHTLGRCAYRPSVSS